jgi:hypothetical protein
MLIRSSSSPLELLVDPDSPAAAWAKSGGLMFLAVAASASHVDVSAGDEAKECLCLKLKPLPECAMFPSAPSSLAASEAGAGAGSG